MTRRVAVLAVMFALSACAGATTEPPSPVVASEPASSAPDASTPRGAFGESGSASSCVEGYAPARITRRAFAFDGTVTAIGDSVSDRGDDGDLGQPGVTFDVHEWFVGHGGAQFTADFTDVPIGTRLLVSGEDRWGEGTLTHPIVWSCGFTRYYDDETAAKWRDVVAQ